MKNESAEACRVDFSGVFRQISETFELPKNPREVAIGNDPKLTDGSPDGGDVITL